MRAWTLFRLLRHSLASFATATDGYRAVFSWPVIRSTAVGDGVLVLFERDGHAPRAQPGPHRSARYRLIASVPASAACAAHCRQNERFSSLHT
jgi:hypothetical protein